jgi:hypothetical protein
MTQEDLKEAFKKAEDLRSGDGRKRLPVPRADDELTPVMSLLDRELASEEPEPPMRNVSGWPVQVRLCEPLGLHELTPGSANDEEDETSRLPPPKTYVLARHDSCSMAILIERYIEFFKRDAKGRQVTKRLPGIFVKNYLAFNKSSLPTVSGILTVPVVTDDGSVLATNGLDRNRKVVFRVDPAIQDILPQEQILIGEIEEALKYLTDRWLIDVQTDYAGKCVLIALALTILERELLPERPAFFVTAGKRGGGKTTAINMVSAAVLGSPGAAAAWSPDEEEQRKSIFAALMQGVPLISWIISSGGQRFHVQQSSGF